MITSVAGRPVVNGLYVKRPIPITVLEAADSDTMRATMPAWVQWRKTRIDGGEVFNRLHDSWIGFTFGDVFNITNEEDVYPIERKVFESTYDKVTDGDESISFAVAAGRV